MDRLRAIRYLAAAADGASLSAAARLHGVSVAAVARLIVALESDMRVQLLARHAGGVTPTVAGRNFLELCRPALAQLDDAVEQATASANRVQGTVVVAVQPVIAQEVLTAALPKFCALYPDIQLDVRYFMNMAELQDHSLDAILVMGWPQQVGDLVGRPLGATTFVVVASPAYWAAHGMPRHPIELEQHNCLCIRSNTSSVMDLWHFKRSDERVTVAARGLLVPALTDWVVDEVPPVKLLYAPSVRRAPRVRVFLDWVVQLFAEVEHERQRPLPATAMPRWMKMRRPRASEAR